MTWKQFKTTREFDQLFWGMLSISQAVFTLAAPILATGGLLHIACPASWHFLVPWFLGIGICGMSATALMLFATWLMAREAA